MQDQDQVLNTIHRFFSLNRLDDNATIVEITEEESQTISNHLVWEVNPELFPLKESLDIKEYFKALADNPTSTRHLPGFDLIKTT